MHSPLPRLSLLLAVLVLGSSAAHGEEAYGLEFGPDGTLGLWSVWETPANEIWLEATLEPLLASPEPMQLVNLVFTWDPARLEAVGAPLAGELFDGQPNAYHNWFDGPAGRTFTSVLLGLDEGQAPAGAVCVMRQKFRALDPAGGLAAVEAVDLVLRNTDNQPIEAAWEATAWYEIDVTPPWVTASS
jgi:hypothetical protein